MCRANSNHTKDSLAYFVAPSPLHRFSPPQSTLGATHIPCELLSSQQNTVSVLHLSQILVFF